MAGFFKKFIDQVKKEYPDVGELIDSARGGKVKQFLQDQVAEITGMGTSSSQQTYGEMLKQEAEEQQARAKDRAERLKTVYRDPADIEMAAEARRLIKARIKDNLRPRNFLWGSKEILDEHAEYIIDNCDKEIDELCAYIESKGVRYDREKMEEEINYFRGHSMLYLYRRNRIEEYIFLDRMTSDEIMELVDGDIRQMEELHNRH